MKRQEFTRRIAIQGREYEIVDIGILEKNGAADVRRLPFAIRILLENLLRKMDGHIIQEEDLIKIARWEKTYPEPVEIPYHPARVLMQDFTGVPAVVDLAAMRDAVKALGGNPERINPIVPVELIVDHSVQVDFHATPDALEKNVEKEYERNGERYVLLKWAQKSFDNFKVVPPNSGICHQVNLEHLGRVVITEETEGNAVAYPDTLVGTDSHTPMINGIGVVGWGVGGIEAEAVMLGEPYFLSIPEVIGVKMVGRLKEGTTATDLVITITELLRKHDVVEKFVEYFGPGMMSLNVPDRATIANMTPEHGATLGFFPVDEKTLEYLRVTGRDTRAEIVERYTKETGLFYDSKEDPEYTAVLELDLSTVEPSVAGPARPQDRIALKDLKKNFTGLLGREYERNGEVADFSRFENESGSCTFREDTLDPSSRKMCQAKVDGNEIELGDGSIVIAAITSCTNTSNPFVMLGAGLVARRAVERGLRVSSFVKTSLAPGSKVVINYLEDAGLMPYLEALGFHLVGFGCTTCIGNSGPLHPEIERTISKHRLSVASVLSGNRNFEARIHQSVKWNFLASPMLVVAFALAGRIDVDLTAEPIALDSRGEPVYLNDIWPKSGEIESLMAKHVKEEFFVRGYERIFAGDEFWNGLQVGESTTYPWDDRSTYIKKPPYFENFGLKPTRPLSLESARVLLLMGDSVTTDHISPAGAIAEAYPAGQYLVKKRVTPVDFNSYGSRRGNHEVMVRGTFGNIRIKNRLVAPKEGGFTQKFPGRREMFIYHAAMEYKTEGIPLVVLGGKEYGTGSSRDWAAKGTRLLGVRAVIAESFERIHRSNLVGMGVLPLMFQEGDSWATLGLDGSETFSVSGIEDIRPGGRLRVKASKPDGSQIRFEVITRLDTEVEVEYYRNGGILSYVLRKMLAGGHD